MSGLYPIPIGRSSGLLIQQRLINQLQSDQQDILRLTSQASTGRRVLAPSDDAPAALRGITLQRILEQKEQAGTNLNASRSYLSASETAVSKVADLLNEVRGLTVQAADESSSLAQRQALVQDVQEAITQLASVGNQKFRDRFLFAGSNTALLPYEELAGRIVYRGNESELRSYADVDRLFSASITGPAVLGGLSAEVRGTKTLTPVLTADTPLSALRGGAGVSLGSIVVSDGTKKSTIDLTGAQTLGDVVRRIEANPPATRSLTVTLGPTGLNIALDAAGGGTLTITESGNGKTAASLGILTPTNATTSIAGSALNPKLRLNSRLDDLLGVRANARLAVGGPNDDIILEARANGAADNGVTIQLVDEELLRAAPGLTAGNETAAFSAVATAPQASLRLSGAGTDLVITATTPGTQYNNVRIELQAVAGLGNAANASYDPNTRRLTIQIDDADQTSIASLTAAVDATGLFTATEDNSAGETLNPAATVIAADAGIIAGDTGNSGGEANTIFVYVERDQSTAANVLAALQADPVIAARFDARFASSAEGAGEGTASLAAAAVTAGGAGEAFDRDSGLRVVVGDTPYTITFTDAVTVEDLLNELNGSPAGLLAQINAAGDGIDIRSRVSGADFHIGENGGTTAEQLGVRSLARDTLLSQLNHGRGVHTADGTDFTIVRSDGEELEIDISSAFTIGEVIDLINSHPDNQDPVTAVVARLTAVGNGIELFDPNPITGEPLTISRAVLSEAAIDLGFIPVGEFDAVADPATNTLTAADVNPYEAAGAFNTLLRLGEAILSGDQRELSRLAGLLEQDLERVTHSRGELGSRQRTLDVLESRLQDENVELRRSLSEEIEADLVETFTNLAARQTALEASLRQSGQILRTSLLDYL